MLRVPVQTAKDNIMSSVFEAKISEDILESFLMAHK